LGAIWAAREATGSIMHIGQLAMIIIHGGIWLNPLWLVFNFDTYGCLILSLARVLFPFLLCLMFGFENVLKLVYPCIDSPSVGFLGPFPFRSLVHSPPSKERERNAMECNGIPKRKGLLWENYGCEGV